MDESIKKTSILLSRNKPVALVVGAASFLGSHLTDKLLEKDIQVIGVDGLEGDNRKNLLKATENQNFHFINVSPDNLELDLDRLDYVFIVTANNNLDNIFKLLKKFHSRCLLVSSIDLYEKSYQDIQGLKQLEGKLAKYASDNNLNARVLRLGSVYGPRMDFISKDPMVRLLQQSLTDDLQKDVNLEFSSRALYYKDAIELVIRTIFAGSTSQKIFDGVHTEPVKVIEIKQILMDPVWYENRDFTPSPLPPWPTPNLEKTVKFLNWHPKSKLIPSLRETLSYFKDNEIEVPRLEIEKVAVSQEEGVHKDEKDVKQWSKDKQEELEAFKTGSTLKKEKKNNREAPKIFIPFSKIYLVLLVSLITYALLWPMLVLGWGVWNYRWQLEAGLMNIEKGELEAGLQNINQAKEGVDAVQAVLKALQPVKKAGILTHEFEQGERVLNIAFLSVSSAKSTILGMQSLLQSIKSVTGEQATSPEEDFKSAQIELSSAGADLSKAIAFLDDKNLQLAAPFDKITKAVGGKLLNYSNLVSKAQAISILLPKLTALDGSKSYLVLLQNNMELRPAGGFIGSFAKVTFEKGKLKKLEVNDIYNIDGNLKIHVEPPKEIKEDLGQKDWFLRDSNWEPDFPTAARQAEWFYTKETGERVEGTIALDISAMENLLSVVGPLDLPDYNEKITSDNLFQKALTHAEMSFFPGSQSKKSFLTGLTNGVFNKMFFLPHNNWPKIISSLAKSLEEKHISIYLDDTKLFSYLFANNFSHALPRPAKPGVQAGEPDLLSLVEANLGANKVNYYINRNYHLETVVGKEGEIKHRLKINYTNRSPSDAFPAGNYKNRMRVYLPMGSKLNRVLWGESDITKDVTSFVDYGRSGYSFLLSLAPKEQKNLILDYTVPVKIEFTGDTAGYRLNIIKQAGMLKDPLQWNITYPLSYKLVSAQTSAIGPQEQSIQTDLSKDRSFVVEFKK